MNQFFEIAAKISSQWSLSAFAIACIIVMVLRLTGKRVPKVAWAVVIAVTVIAAMPIFASVYLDNFGLYRVRITITRDATPVENVEVKCSPSGEVLKTGSGWECDIPAKSRPAAGQLTVYAVDRAAFLRGTQTLKLENDYAPSVRLSLEPDTSAIIRGSVLDNSAPPRPLARAQVHIVGYESESVVTGDGGDFVLKAHAANGQQVKLAVTCAGYDAFLDWRQAGTIPVEIRLSRSKTRRNDN